jgi:cysteine desulfurase/selenocysteine lyase
MTMNITNDFPMLNRKIFDKDITYLDSAACSLKPYTVIETERLYGINLTSNVHRSHNALSEDLSYQYERVREKISEFIHSDPVSVIMTPNTSYALTMIANGLQLCSDDKVLCSMMNHNSNLLPWMNVAKVVYFQSENIEPLSLDSVITAIEYHQPKVLAISYISNVSGVMNPIAEICKLAHERGVITVIDAAQAAPHVPINVATLNCNFLAFSGHKILGPTGTGILYGKYELLENLKPLVLAG